jgi:hypothetical protein
MNEKPPPFPRREGFEEKNKEYRIRNYEVRKSLKG